MSARSNFAAWQPRYAEHGVATFPVADGSKRPAITNFGKVGLLGSRQLALKFAEARSFAFMAGRRNRLLVIDLDDTDPQIIRIGEQLFGPSPLLWCTGSGKFAMPFRFNGERRRIRPIPGLPIDLLGGGVVVAPGSMGARRKYQIIQGSLDDLDRLPTARMPDEIARAMAADRPRGDDRVRIAKGRNDWLFRLCLRHAPAVDDIEALRDVAHTINADNFVDPLGDKELEKTLASAWGYQQRSSNWVGAEQRLQTTKSVIIAFATHQNGADALLLYDMLRCSRWQQTRFAASPPALSKAKLIPTWSRERYRSALAALVEIGALRIVHRGGQGPGDHRLYAFSTTWPKGPESRHSITEHPPPLPLGGVAPPLRRRDVRR